MNGDAAADAFGGSWSSNVGAGGFGLTSGGVNGKPLGLGMPPVGVGGAS